MLASSLRMIAVAANSVRALVCRNSTAGVARALGRGAQRARRLHTGARPPDPSAAAPRRLVQAPSASDTTSAATAGSGSLQGMAVPAAAAQVAVITTLGCPYCKKAKAALQAAGIPYQEYELSEQVEVLTKVKAASGQSTVPQIFVGGRLLGGASNLLPMLENGSLQKLLAGTTAPALPQELQAVVGAARGQQEAAAAAEDPQRAEQRQLAAELRDGVAGSGSSVPTFTLQQAAQWLQQSRSLSPDAAASTLGQLQAAQLLALAERAAEGVGEQPALTGQLLQARPQLLLRLVGDAPRPTKWKEPLNGQYAWFGPARPAAEVAEGLRLSLVRLYDKYLSADGKKVDYRGMRADPAFAEFAAATAELQKVDLSGLATREQKMAFFVNIYNALVVHALVVFGAADGTLSRLQWFDSISYLIGGRRWSSNDVEHGALRGNAPSPASLFSLLGKPKWAGPTFKAGDPRAALAIKPVDPRIHFALNCGAASCPPIRVYTPNRLEFGLEAAAQAFCASEVQVDKASGALELSMILKWYGPDFGTKAQLLDFLVAHLPPGPQADLKDLLDQRGVDGIKLTFRPYDWTTNSAD